MVIFKKMKRKFLFSIVLIIIIVLIILFANAKKNANNFGILQLVEKEQKNFIEDDLWRKLWKRITEIIGAETDADETSYEEIPLSVVERQKLESILESYNLQTEKTTYYSSPFLGEVCYFLLSDDNGIHVLSMPYNGPVRGGGSFNMKCLTIQKASRNYKGYYVTRNSELGRDIDSPQLYIELESYLKNLPESHQARALYNETNKMNQN